MSYMRGPSWRTDGNLDRWIGLSVTAAADLPIVAAQIATHQVAEYIESQDIWVPKAPLSTSRFRFDGAYVEVGANQGAGRA